MVGLGNPGRTYERTRHNVGFEVIDELVRRCAARMRKSWTMPVQSVRTELAGEDVRLVKARTYMNRSGLAIRPLLKRQGLDAGDLVVVLDDVELDAGRLRIRPGGGAGGHKGLASVIGELGTEDFVRVRVGVGPRPPGEDLVDHVLGRFSAEERERIDEAVRKAADAVSDIVREGVEKAMNRFNG